MGTDARDSKWRRPWLRILRLASGVILLILTVGIVFGDVSSDAPVIIGDGISVSPVINCGGPAIQLIFDRDDIDAPPRRVDECADNARAQVLGTLFIAGIPGVLLLTYPRWRYYSPRAIQELETARSRETGVWRMSALSRRLATWAIVILVVTFGVLILLADVLAIGVTALVFSLFAAGIWCTTIRPRLVAGPALLSITNPLNTRTVGLAYITRVVAGYWGITISQRTQPAVRAWMGQKSNWAVIRSTSTYADDIVKDIALRAATIQHRDPSDFVLDATEREAKRKLAQKEVILGVIFLAISFIVREIVFKR